MERLVLEGIDEFNHRSLADILWSFGQLKYGSERFYNQLATTVAKKLHKFDSNSLTTTILARES